MAAQPLPGGFVTTVVRVGDTVRRSPSPAFVPGLLGWLERQGWPGAPRYLGVDEDGREILTYLDGVVPWADPTADLVTEAAALRRVGALVRELHDLTAGTPLAGEQEVVCHNDLSPKNTVYRDGGEGLRPVAFLDWDLAAPGERLADVGHLCWQFSGAAPDADVAVVANRMRLLCDGYGQADRTGVLDAVLGWQDRCGHGIEKAAAAGEPAMVRLRDRGAAAHIRATHRWTEAHRHALFTGLACASQGPGAL